MPKILVSFSKKLPLAGIDYSSQQASISIEADVSADHFQEEAHRLYSQAEQAVDAQLRCQGTQNRDRPAEGPQRGLTPRLSEPSQNGRPYVKTTRRSPPPASDSQLRLLKRLLNGDHGRLDRILAHYEVSTLEALTIPQASEAIDHLKAGVS